MKIFRAILLLCILWVSIYAWWFVYHWVFELLDFQIGMYKSFLQAWEKVDAVQDSLWGIVEKALWMFWTELPIDTSWQTLTEEQLKTISEKINWFEKKLKIVSWIIGGIVWLLVWKILSDIIFWLRKTIANVSKFIG